MRRVLRQKAEVRLNLESSTGVSALSNTRAEEADARESIMKMRLIAIKAFKTMVYKFINAMILPISEVPLFTHRATRDDRHNAEVSAKAHHRVDERHGALCRAFLFGESSFTFLNRARS